MSDSIDQYIEEHLSDSVAELSRLCVQPSMSAQGLGIRECAELVAEMLRARGFSATIHPTAGHPIVTAHAQGERNKTLLFYNHYDVQPPEPLELRESPPFAPTVREGKLFARGVVDDKGHIVPRLAALRVPSLSLPPADMSTCKVLTRSEAAQLFLDRAVIALPGLVLADADAPTVARICRRLDGIALAIELATSRIKLLKVEQIAARRCRASRRCTPRLIGATTC